eukprot:7598950-Karenia_brevis.AAC.1
MGIGMSLTMHHQSSLMQLRKQMLLTPPTMHHQYSLMLVLKLISFSAAITAMQLISFSAAILRDGTAMHHQHSLMLA